MSNPGEAGDGTDHDASFQDTDEDRQRSRPSAVRVPTLSSGELRPERVEAELKKWYLLDGKARSAMLRSIIEGRAKVCAEKLVHVCQQAFNRDDERTLNLAFEALSRSVTPLLISQARGLVIDEKQEQAQEVLLHLFGVIREGKAEFAETNFAAFAKRRAISLYRSRQSKFENANSRVEPSRQGDEFDDEPQDPMDLLPARVPSPEARRRPKPFTKRDVRRDQRSGSADVAHKSASVIAIGAGRPLCRTRAKLSESRRVLKASAHQRHDAQEACASAFSSIPLTLSGLTATPQSTAQTMRSTFGAPDLDSETSATCATKVWTLSCTATPRGLSASNKRPRFGQREDPAADRDTRFAHPASFHARRTAGRRSGPRDDRSGGRDFLPPI